MTMSKSEAGKLGAVASIKICAENKNQRVITYNLAPKLCAECLSPIPYEKRKGKFCGHTCSAIHNNKKRKIVNHCAFCAKEINKGRTYCNAKCQREHEHKERVESWLKGVGEIGKRSLKKYLKDTFGDKCSECGIEEWNNAPIVFELEHKDGNSENNAPDNVCLICPNCHSQTSTFKGRNKGNGRHYRRLRYQEGKSF